MKRTTRILILFLISLLLTGCFAQTENPKQPQGPTPEELAAQELAKKTAEREALETQRKADLGEFYVPLPPLSEEPQLKTVTVKALYLTANVAGFKFKEEDVEYYARYIRSKTGQSSDPIDESRMGDINKLEKILAMVEATEINALVIDIKNDTGLVTWNSDVALVNNIGSNWESPLKDYSTLMTYLQSKDIYTIARIVAFKDPYFAQKEPAHAIQLKAGGVYKDNAGFAWVNPFDPYVQNYQIAIAQEAALRGFDEIQFDYVRFPDNAAKYNPITDFPGRDGQDKDEAIAGFLAKAKTALEPYKVHLSADVFGVITHSWDDKPEDIGQTWRLIANNTDYICPMIYPSHYGSGFYGFPVPDAHPYEVVRAALLEAIERNAAQKDPAIIRSWYQGFTAPWVKGHIPYDAKAVSDQLVAGADLGLEEYIIWHSSNNYDFMSFFYQDRVKPVVTDQGTDILGRTPEDALKRYFEAETFKRYNVLYLLTPLTERVEDFDAFAQELKDSEKSLLKYEILSTTKNDDGSYSLTVNANYKSLKGKATLENAAYTVILENRVYKVISPELTWVAEESKS